MVSGIPTTLEAGHVGVLPYNSSPYPVRKDAQKGRFQFRAFASSLAVTEAIIVIFFSSTY